MDKWYTSYPVGAILRKDESDYNDEMIWSNSQQNGILSTTSEWQKRFKNVMNEVCGCGKDSGCEKRIGSRTVFLV